MRGEGGEGGRRRREREGGGAGYLIVKLQAHCVRFLVVESSSLFISSHGNHHPIVISQWPERNQLQGRGRERG